MFEQIIVVSLQSTSNAFDSSTLLLITIFLLRVKLNRKSLEIIDEYIVLARNIACKIGRFWC